MTLPRVRVPGDKSISHRALLLGALAEGESTLRGLLTGADVQSTAGALRALGCDVPPLDAGEIRLRGVGLRAFRAPAVPIDCGNSGTTARLLLGILAGQPVEAVLTGDASLRGRPMKRVTAPLARMGAHFEFLENEDRLPVRVRGGALQPLAYDAPHASAQVKSALLLAGLVGGVPVHVREPRLSRDHTERMLLAQGVGLECDAGDNGAAVSLAPVAALRPLDLRVPGDFSSAAFLLALGVLRAPGVEVAGVGVNPTRTGMLAVLARMGAPVERMRERSEGGEPVADLRVRPTPLRATTIAAEEIPSLIDEIPVLAALAVRAQGTTRIRGAGELRVKETDRIHALVHNLRALGVRVEEHPDGMDIHGTDAPLAGAVRTFDDHRIAMAFGVLGALPDSSITIDDPAVVGISFPGFWQMLETGAR
ncbi:MAG TPA: 3-phosphoshikimate 1-carboxyvinyltransferase [Albitalea sp.]